MKFAAGHVDTTSPACTTRNVADGNHSIAVIAADKLPIGNGNGMRISKSLSGSLINDWVNLPRKGATIHEYPNDHRNHRQ